MLLNFQREFCNFLETPLDAIGSFELILRFIGNYKRLVVEFVLLVIHVPSSEKDN